MLSHILISAMLTVLAVEPGTVGAIVQEAFPKAEVTMTGETDGVLEGVLADGKGSEPFTVAPVRAFEHEGTGYVAMVVAFPFKEESPLEDYLAGKELDPPRHKAVLISARTEAPHEPRCVTLDKRADACQYGDFDDSTIWDHLMDGTQQLAMSGMSFYLLSEPREIIHAQWYTIYRVPELELCARKLTMRMVYSETGQTELTYRSWVHLEGTGENGNRRLVVEDKAEKKLNVLPVKEGKADFPDERPWEREKAEVKKRRSKGRKTARIRVIDENGAPIGGLKISGRYHVPSGTWAEGHNEDVEGETDASGRYSTEVKGYTTLRVRAQGYYTKKVNFSWAKFPEDEQVVVLEKERPRVLMYESRLQERFTTDQQKYEYGVKFVDTYEAGQQISIAKSRDEADMWFCAIKTGEPPKDVKISQEERLGLFQVSIECRNGWELAPAGKRTLEKIMHEGSDEAFEEGYVGKLEGVAADVPTLFYLRKDGGKRYGKMYVEFHDFSGRWNLMRRLNITYSVQAKNVGSRYLNPAKR